MFNFFFLKINPFETDKIIYIKKYRIRFDGDI